MTRVALQSVKDVLQSLVDDGMVNSDRIGTSNYFWAFPSEAFNTVCVCALVAQSNCRVMRRERGNWMKCATNWSKPMLKYLV